ncbi:MAG: hypothetical protein ACKN9U_22485 [Pirellulaceae bacterium]
MASQPHQVRIVPPNSWRDIATALPHPDNDPWTRTARDFDHLVDSPILLGNSITRPSRLAARPTIWSPPWGMAIGTTDEPPETSRKSSKSNRLGGAMSPMRNTGFSTSPANREGDWNTTTVAC